MPQPVAGSRRRAGAMIDGRVRVRPIDSGNGSIQEPNRSRGKPRKPSSRRAPCQASEQAALRCGVAQPARRPGPASSPPPARATARVRTTMKPIGVLHLRLAQTAALRGPGSRAPAPSGTGQDGADVAVEHAQDHGDDRVGLDRRLEPRGRRPGTRRRGSCGCASPASAGRAAMPAASAQPTEGADPAAAPAHRPPPGAAGSTARRTAAAP